MRAHPLFGYLLLLVTALSWAGAWITARVAAHDAPPMTVTAGRFLVASLLLLPVWWVLVHGRDVHVVRRSRCMSGTARPTDVWPFHLPSFSTSPVHVSGNRVPGISLTLAAAGAGLHPSGSQPPVPLAAELAP
jgi:drug/metabolite transporter (DMT)-like permease